MIKQYMMDQFGNRIELVKRLANIVFVVLLSACSVAYRSGAISWGNIEALLADESVHRHLHYSSATVCVKGDVSKSICRVANNKNDRFVFASGTVELDTLSSRRRVLNLTKLNSTSVGAETWQFELQDEGLLGKGTFGADNSVTVTDTIYR